MNKLLLKQAEAILDDENILGALANITAFISEQFPTVSWAGFYFLKNDKLFLGPKDTKALHYLSSQVGSELKTVKACIEVNDNQKIRLYEKLVEDLGNLKGKNIAVLGLTFKPGTDDLREAPSIYNIELLLDGGVIIKAYDPISIESFKRRISYKLEDDGIIGSISLSISV